MADAFDYIVVDSGAGGGPLAARLAEAGRSVLLLEAGGDPRQLSGTNDYPLGINRLPKYVRDYRGVPVNGVLYPRAGTLGAVPPTIR